MEPCKTKKLGVSRSFSVIIIAHDGETWLEQSGGERMGGIQWRLLLKVPEECPSGCRWGGIVLAVGMGEALGQGGNFNDDNP